MGKKALDNLSDYFGVSLDDSLEVDKDFISTGCTLADLALGGGFISGRVIGEMGDPSSGKTALALSVAKHFQLKYNDGIVCFNDAEAALDEYWVKYGFNMDGKRFKILKSDTVEHFVKSATKVLELGVPVLYILDSLDALDTEESNAEDADTTNMKTKLSKPAVMSQLLKKLVRKYEQNKSTLIIISQSKAKIGVLFGDKTDITGGSAAKFYASQRIKVATVSKIEGNRTLNGKQINRVIGMRIRLKVIKNKVALPFKQVDFNFYFDSGIDDVESNIDFLEAYSDMIGSKKNYQYKSHTFKKKSDLIEFIKTKDKRISKVQKMVKQLWESEFK